MRAKHKTSFSVSQEAERLLRLLAEKLAVSKSAIIEIAIRKMAKAENIE